MFAATVLLSTPAFAAIQFGSRMLTMGMRGADVRTLQKDLTLTGFATRDTGVFNRTTENHVIDFQRRYHLSADGVVGPQTISAIRGAVARARAKAAATKTNGAAGTGPTSSTQSAPNSSQIDPVTNQPVAPLSTADSGGASVVPPPSDSPVEDATINSEGLAVAPADAPEVIRDVIAAANKIAFKPYVYGGGHASFDSSGYDCSGSVSYALHGGGLLKTPLDSTQFESYGDPGAGRWISIWGNSGHAYMEIAGLFFDTVSQQETGDRWSAKRADPSSGYVEVHPAGW